MGVSQAAFEFTIEKMQQTNRRLVIAIIGRGAKRDAMGRYSRDGYSRDTAAELREMSMFLPANKREEMERIIMQME